MTPDALATALEKWATRLDAFFYEDEITLLRAAIHELREGCPGCGAPAYCSRCTPLTATTKSLGSLSHS